MSRGCGTCGAPLQLIRMPEITGSAGGTTTYLRRFPVIACPVGHERWEPHADFNTEIVEEIFYHKKVPIAKTHGLFRKQPECCRCGAALNGVPEAPAAIRSSIRDHGSLEFELEIAAPLVTCPGCQLAQFHGTAGTEWILDAIVDAFEKNGIKRPWRERKNGA